MMKLPLSYWDIVAKVCQFSFTDLNICTILFPISYGTNKTQKDYSLQESVLLACHKNAISSKAFRRCHFVTSFEAESFCRHHEREGSSFCRNLTFANSQKWPHPPWTLFPSGTNHINTFLLSLIGSYLYFSKRLRYLFNSDHSCHNKWLRQLLKNTW